VSGNRCNDCHKSISPQYPIIELLTGAAFVLAGIITNFNLLTNNYLLGVSNTFIKALEEINIINPKKSMLTTKIFGFRIYSTY